MKTSNTLKNHIDIVRRSKIRRQIINTFSVAAIIPIMVLGVFSFMQITKEMNRHYSAQAAADSERVGSILFDVTTSVFTSSEAITADKGCMELFGSRYATETEQGYYGSVSRALETFHDNTAAISSIFIYTDNPYIPSGSCIKSLADYKGQDWYKAINSDEWNVWTSLRGEDSFHNQQNELTLIRRIGIISRQYTAYMVIRIDGNYLKNRILQNDYVTMINVDRLPVFYSGCDSYLLKKMPFSDDFGDSYYKYAGKYRIDGHKALINISTIRPYKTEDRFHILTADTEAYDEIKRMQIIYAVIMLIAVAAPTYVIMLFSSYFSRRVTSLKTAMHQASEGDYNIMERLQGDDELTETFTDLQKTVQQIHEKEARYYEASLNEQKLINRQQQMEYSMLASQINPHFLYNTLETIRMQAISDGDRNVAESIKLLGKSMHYVLESTGSTYTSLKKELEYTDTYLKIQKLRFGDRVNAAYDIQTGIDTDNCRILPLLIQPIVENAISHGLEKRNENGMVTIGIHEQAGRLIINITDNGKGMNVQALTELREHIMKHDPSDTGSIGLYNISQRIHLFYGTEYCLEIESKEGEGTCVTLELPYDVQAQG
jgi:two-component system sensor histidine kinase YesM